MYFLSGRIDILYSLGIKNSSMLLSLMNPLSAIWLYLLLVQGKILTLLTEIAGQVLGVRC